MEQHRDEHIDCADCGASFVFSADEAAVFVERGLAAPKRCKECRRARKERAASGAPRGSGPDFSGSSQRAPDHGVHGNIYRGQGAAPRYGAPQRRYTGDVNEYRNPMQDGFSGSPFGTAPRMAAPWQRSAEYRSPMPDGFVGRGPDPRSPRLTFADGGSRSARTVNGERDGNHRPNRVRQEGSSRPQAFDPRVSAGGAAPQGGYGRPRPAARHPATEGGASKPSHDGSDPRPKPRPPAEASRRRPQAEMFAITCDACGAQAEVPFKPAEGREVYCATCYRARRPSAP